MWLDLLEHRFSPPLESGTGGCPDENPSDTVSFVPVLEPVVLASVLREANKGMMVRSDHLGQPTPVLQGEDLELRNQPAGRAQTQ